MALPHVVLILQLHVVRQLTVMDALEVQDLMAQQLPHVLLQLPLQHPEPLLRLIAQAPLVVVHTLEALAVDIVVVTAVAEEAALADVANIPH